MRFNGKLNTNKMFASLYNQIISLQVFDTGIEGLDGLYDTRRVDGTLHGDTKLYISTDALRSYEWDGTDTPGGYNLLTTKRPPAPVEEAIVIDVFRQIPVTIDDYLTKQAFANEGDFGAFNGVILDWLNKTKQVYEHTKYTADIVTAAEDKAKAFPDIDLKGDADMKGYDLLRWRAQEFFRQLEDNLRELKEPSREYNDLGFLRNYNEDDFDIVVPLGVLSSVRKHDIPFLFNADEKPWIKEIHWKYFGTVNATPGTATATNKTVRSLIETEYAGTHVFPGDLVPNSAAYKANETYTATYTERPSLNEPITALLIHKRDFPIMSAFSVGTSFFNARRLDLNSYLTFGHNNVAEAHLGERALLKVSTTVA